MVSDLRFLNPIARASLSVLFGAPESARVFGAMLARLRDVSRFLIDDYRSIA